MGTVLKELTGDKNKRLKDIVKITSGSNLKISKFISDLYSLIIKAGIYRVKSIKIAEAAKVIENTQRDLNIAFINELSLILKKWIFQQKMFWGQQKQNGILFLLGQV